MTQSYKTEDLPILADFMVVGLAFCLSNILENGKEADVLLKLVSERCIEQGFKKKHIDDVFIPLFKHIKAAME